MIKNWLGRGRRQVLNTARRGLSVVFPYSPMIGTAEVLDREYLSGDWDCLRDVEEVPRHGVMAGYCNHLRPGGAILEVGCGEGVLQEQLDAARYSSYLGIDLSAEAIHRTEARQSERTRFVVADAATFIPDRRYDLVLFNECLEYFAEPLALCAATSSFSRRTASSSCPCSPGSIRSHRPHLADAAPAIQGDGSHAHHQTAPGIDG